MKVLRLPHAAGLPTRATPGAAGLDLRAAEDFVLVPGQRKLVPTGLVVALGPGFEGRICPRSGLALHHGITVLNAPGILDADYRGELKVLLINLGETLFEGRRGDRIAQLVIGPIWTGALEEVGELDTTQRSGGFGSTGKA